MDFANGHAHCMSMLLGSAGESIPVADGDLALGTWQRILFMELDRERDRRWLVKVVGS
jgi:secondary thiamine-phosphate synthase enzyme